MEYRSIVVPVVRSAESEEALLAAARLAAERRSRVAIVHVLEMPMELPLTAGLPSAEREANDLLDDARALVESYGVRAVTRLERARSAGPAIVADAVARTADLVVMGAPRRGLGRRTPVFGKTVRHVLKHSPCRVIVATAREEAAAGVTRGSVPAVLAGVVVLLGVAVIARTLALGVGGGLGLLIGGLLVIGGGLRLYLLRPWRRS